MHKLREDISCSPKPLAMRKLADKPPVDLSSMLGSQSPKVLESRARLQNLAASPMMPNASESSRPIFLKRLEDPLKTRKQEISNHFMRILVNVKFVDPAHLGALERKLANTLALLEASAVRHESLCDDDDLDSSLDDGLGRSYGANVSPAQGLDMKLSSLHVSGLAGSGASKKRKVLQSKADMSD